MGFIFGCDLSIFTRFSTWIMSLSCLELRRISDDGFFKELPEELIDYIMSFLTIKELVVLSSVSKSWERRWRMCTTLDLDQQVIGKTRLVSDPTESFVRHVNQILESHCGERIDSFRISSIMSKRYTSDFDGWIEFAKRKQARTLVIDFGIFYCENELNSYSLPSWFPAQEVSVTEHLSLNNVGKEHLKFRCFKNLKSLTLCHVDICDSLLRDISDCCCSLRNLSIIQCYCDSTLKFLVPRNLVKLCLSSGLENLCEIEFEGPPNLISLECPLKALKGSAFRKIQSLRRLALTRTSVYFRKLLCVHQVVYQLAEDFSGLESLHLSLRSTKLFKDDGGDGPCQRLRETLKLKLFYRLNSLTLFDTELFTIGRAFADFVLLLLSVSPVLHTLELRMVMGNCPYPSGQILAGAGPLNNLKVVKVYGYYYTQVLSVDLVVYLLENAKNLQILEIKSDITQPYLEDGNWGTLVWNYEDSDMTTTSTKVIEEWLLKYTVSSNVKFTVS